MDIYGIIFYAFILCLGTTIGSFLNVVIYRFNTGMRFDEGRSMCFSCSKKLEWYELIPLVSFIIQLGRCRNCKSRIAWQYPIVELLTAVIFLLTTYHLGTMYSFDSSVFVMYLVGYMFLWSLCVVMAVYDIRHKMIPSLFVYLSIALAFVLRVVSGAPITNILICIVVVALPLWLLYFLSKERWMGFGDVLIAILMGTVLGFSKGLTALMLAFWIGAIYGIMVMLIGKIKNRKTLNLKSALPFGPFLLIALFVVYLMGWTLPTIIEWFA